MKKFLLLLVIYVFAFTPVFSEVLQAGVSVNEVPEALFGSWRISAKLDKTNAYNTFKPQSLDGWNLSRQLDVLTLQNPLTGAESNVSINAVEGNLVVFTRKDSSNKNKILTEKVQIRLDENTFSGIDTLKLESYSYADGHLMKTETATYFIKGEKISGTSVLKK